jgi:hypothetical protein
VCAEWAASFENFWRDMGPSYRRGLTLDRLDNDQGYSIHNCEWRTYKQQAQNTRRYTGIDMFALSTQTGVPRSTLFYRWKKGLRGAKLVASVDTKKSLAGKAGQRVRSST